MVWFLSLGWLIPGMFVSPGACACCRRHRGQKRARKILDRE
jgi:hypothetical protein